MLSQSCSEGYCKQALITYVAHMNAYIHMRKTMPGASKLGATVIFTLGTGRMETGTAFFEENVGSFLMLNAKLHLLFPGLTHPSIHSYLFQRKENFGSCTNASSNVHNSQ